MYLYTVKYNLLYLQTKANEATRSTDTIIKQIQSKTRSFLGNNMINIMHYVN